ncbi:MAG: hypothetical protein GWO78_05245 [Dehalococcoidales bacterium]|jgi:hypothetical protein|nr:hypothetical protein [Dehalococcoidales bacterium]
MIIDDVKIPDYSLSQSIEFIKPIAFSNISSINKFQFANLRGFNPTGGAFNLRLSSARLWGLLSDGNPLSVTSLGRLVSTTENNKDKFEVLSNTSKNFKLLNRLSRDLGLSPTLNEISRLLNNNLENKSLRKLKNIILDIRLHKSNISNSMEEKFIESKDLKLQMSGIKIEVEESKESLLAAIKLLESRLDLFRV